jgi:RNA polymerase sigma factor, sigma-70 family
MDKYNLFFENLCQKNYNNVYKYLLIAVKNREAANDIVQDTFIVVYKNIEKVYNHINPDGFVFKTAQNLARNYKKTVYKQIINEVNLDEGLINSNISTIESSIDSNINEYDYIPEIIDSLSEKNKMLYNMYYVEHKPMKLIAEELGFEYTALRMKYVRLRKEIKTKIKDLAENKFVT